MNVYKQIILKYVLYVIQLLGVDLIIVRYPAYKSQLFLGCTASCPEELRGLVNTLSCSSAVCATFRLSDKELLKKLLYEKLSSERKYELQSKIPVLFDFLSSLEQIPNYLRPILEEIVVIIERTFVYPINDTMKIGKSADSSNDLSFFSQLSKNKTARDLCHGQIERGKHLLKEIYSPFFSVARNFHCVLSTW